MSNMDFSPQQKDAIYSLDEELLVSAGAGSGKTTVLVERILRYVEAGGDISSVLALTFTNAAAADMRAKLDRSLSAMLAERPNDLHLQRQLSLLPQAQISTIHSFCLELLRSNYFRIGLPAGFKVAAENDMSLLKQEILLQCMEEAYEDESSDIALLADMYGGVSDDSALMQTITDLHEFCRSRADTFDWLDKAAATFASDKIDDCLFAPYLAEHIKNIAKSAVEYLREGARAAASLVPVWQDTLNEELALAQEITLAQGLSDVLQQLAAMEFFSLRKNKNDDPAIVEQVKAARNKAKKLLQKLEKEFCRFTVEQHWARIKKLYRPMKALAKLVRRFDEMFAAAKRDKGWVDFSDMELFTLAVLSEAEVCGEIQGKYIQILIDEYQDINEVQETILRALKGNNHIFAVGDVKQSIYRFRLAEPELFLNKYDRYGAGHGGRRIDLNYNYRSQKAVIEGVNYIFDHLMYTDSAELAYDEAARLHTHHTDDSAEPEFLLVDMDTADGSRPPLTAMEAEAELICQRIKKLHRQGYAYGDMAVLLRNSKNRDQAIIAKLTAAGIPTVHEGGRGYLDTVEVQLIISCLQIIDNPLQDIPLVAVMRSVLGGFTAAELAEIRAVNKTDTFYRAVQERAEQEDALAEKCRDFLRQLFAWRDLAAGMSVSHVLLHLYAYRGFYQLVGAFADGETRQADLRLLLQEAYDFENHDYSGLFRFIRRLDKIRAAKLGSPAPAGAMSADGVHIMTIHKSKGLEFPVVFVAGLAGKFNFSDQSRDIIFQRDLGLGAVTADRRRRRKYATLCHEAVDLKLRELTLAEEIRIYYVALTRAKEKLILVSAAKNMRDRITHWQEQYGKRPLDIDYIRSADSPLTWLGGALLQHEDAGPLRLAAGIKGLQGMWGEGHWQMSLRDVEELLYPDEKAEAQTNTFFRKDMPISARVNAALTYHYPQREECGAPAKFTVSGILRAQREEAVADTAHELAAQEEIAEEIQVEDSLSREEAMERAALRGTATHALLEHLISAEKQIPLDRASLHALADKLTAQGILQEKARHLLNISGISRFCQRDLGKRLLGSEQRCTELPFTMLEHEEEADGAVIQGIIDVVFREDDGWVLMDYKTGGRGKSDEELTAIYGPQLAWYKKAVSRLLGAPVKECWLAMLDLDRDIFIP